MIAIIGESRFGVEEIDTAETREEAEFLLGEYQLAFGEDWKIWTEDQDWTERGTA